MKVVFKSNGVPMLVYNNISNTTVEELLKLKERLERLKGIQVDMILEN